MQVLHAAIDTILCLIKEGSIIPFGPELQYTGEIIWINKTQKYWILKVKQMLQLVMEAKQ